MNIQFGKNKNNTNKVKKVYNQGTIITARPQTAKYPYKILSIREFPKPMTDDKKAKKPQKYKKHIFNEKYTIKKSFSYVEDSFRGKNNKKAIKNKNLFNKSSLDNNYVLYTNIQKVDRYGDDRRRKIFSATHRKKSFSSINNEYNKELLLAKNRNILLKNGNEANYDNKKKVSSYSLSKYIEKYIDKNYLDNNNKRNMNQNIYHNINSDIYNKLNNDDNSQIINFLSEVINTENINNNYNFHTASNILTNYNKNNKKATTRNLIIKRQYKKNKNQISLSYTKNFNNELKPLIINFKEKFNILKDKKEKINHTNNNFLKYKSKIENGIKLNKNNFSKIQNEKHSTENNIITIKRPLSIETIKKVYKINTIEKEEKKDNNSNGGNTNDNNTNDNNKNNFDKYKLKNRYKKKLKFSKDLRIKNKKKKSFNSHEINKGYLQYVNSLKNAKLNYIGKANNYRGFQYGKNCDIYDYLISPKVSEGVTEEATKNDYIEFKSINH